MPPLEQRAAAAKVRDIKARESLFQRLWALKEAYGKARGIGIEYDLQQASFEVEGGEEGGAARLTLDGKVVDR